MNRLLLAICLLVAGVSAVGQATEEEEQFGPRLESRFELGETDTGQREEEESRAGGLAEEPMLVPELLEPARLGSRTYMLPFTGTVYEESMAPFSRFIAHRGAGGRILTFRNVLAPREPFKYHEYGPWTFAGGLSLSQLYTDNVFLTPSDEKSEFTTVIMPQLAVMWARSNFSSALRYTGQFFRPCKFHSENQRENHQVGFQAEWQIRSSLRLRMENVYGIRSVSADFEGDRYTRYWDDQTILALIYNPWPDWEVEVGYDRYQARFHEVTADNVTTNGFGVTLSRRVAPAVWAQGSLRYADVENHDVGSTNTDNDVYTASLGVRFEPIAPVVGTAHVGFSWKDFDSSTISDEDGLYINTGLAYSPREWAHLFLTARRSIEETSVTALTAPSGASLERTAGSLGARFDVTERWGFGVLGFVARDDYPSGSSRVDDLYGGTISWFYKLNEWAQVTARYQYQRNDSNVNANDFTENFVHAGLQLTF